MAGRGKLEDSLLNWAGVHLTQFQSVCSQQRHCLAFLCSPTGHFSWFYHFWPNANFLIKCTTWFQMFVYLFQKGCKISAWGKTWGRGKVFYKIQGNKWIRTGMGRWMLGRAFSADPSRPKPLASNSSPSRNPRFGNKIHWALTSFFERM